jgi:hypothetical protein
MFRSLRSTLILPWLFVAVVCCALTFQLRGLFELGIGGEIGKVKDPVKNSAEQIKQEFSLYLTGFSEAPADFGDSDRHRELLLLLDLVLGRFYGIAAAFQKLTAGFVVLLLLMLAAGALNLRYLHRWGQELLQIKERLLAIVRLDRLTLKSTKIRPWLEECIAPFRNTQVTLQ